MRRPLITAATLKANMCVCAKVFHIYFNLLALALALASKSINEKRNDYYKCFAIYKQEIERINSTFEEFNFIWHNGAVEI